MYVLPPVIDRDPPHCSLLGRLPCSTVTPPPSQGSYMVCGGVDVEVMVVCMMVVVYMVEVLKEERKDQEERKRPPKKQKNGPPTGSLILMSFCQLSRCNRNCQ